MNQPSTLQEQRETLTLLPEYSTLNQSLEKQKDELLTYLEALSEEDRNRNATTAEWSPLQVMEHIVVVEEWMAGPNQALPPANGKVLFKGHLFIILGGGLMRSGLRMPTIPMAEPGQVLDFTAIKLRWHTARTLLASKLEAVTQETQPLPIALHPMAGPLNAKQVLGLLDVHLAYHLRHLPRVK